MFLYIVDRKDPAHLSLSEGSPVLVQLPAPASATPDSATNVTSKISPQQ